MVHCVFLQSVLLQTKSGALCQLSMGDSEGVRSLTGPCISVNYKDTTITVTILPENMFQISKQLIYEMNQVLRTLLVNG